jgi:ribosomal protein S18 acetylase RimI-like enzyme
MSDPPCELLDWDTEFFGCRIARATTRRVSRSSLSAIEGWSRENRIDCLYLLADPADRATLDAVHGGPFRLVDVRLTFERPLDSRVAATGVPAAGGIRPAEPSDLERLCSLARDLHTDSRFFFDPGFPVDRCRDLYETWMRRSLEGWADLVLTEEGDENGEPAGYVTCHAEMDGAGRIGLVGVAASARGRGTGRRLVESAVAWLQRQRPERVEVVTQARNIAAQRLYQRCGFLSRDVGFWYHRWFR